MRYLLSKKEKCKDFLYISIIILCSILLATIGHFYAKYTYSHVSNVIIEGVELHEFK